MTNGIGRQLLFLTLTIWANCLNAITIDFDELGDQPCCFNDQDSMLDAALNDQYSHLGVSFSGGWQILNQSGGYGVSATSGEHFAAYNISYGYVGVTNTLTVDFDHKVSTVSGFLGDGTDSSWVVTALRGSSEVSQMNLMNRAEEYVEFNFDGLIFDSVEIAGAGRHAVLDDLSFEASKITQVPEPLSLVLLVLGLVVVGGSGKNGFDPSSVMA